MNTETRAEAVEALMRLGSCNAELVLSTLTDAGLCVDFIPESFANTPHSMAELKASKTGSAGEWKPRDLLLSLLRRLDRKELDLQRLVIVSGITNPGNDVSVRVFAASTVNAHENVGMLEHGIKVMLSE